MPPVVNTILQHLGHSVYRFLRSTQYQSGDPPATGTLLTHFTQLTIIPAYPPDITKLLGPTLALGSPESIGTITDYYGEGGQDQVILQSVYGFVLKQGEQGNRLYRDRLMNDVSWLFDTVARHAGITIYDQATKGEIGDIEVSTVQARALPEATPSVEADRFKFVVDLQWEITAYNTF